VWNGDEHSEPFLNEANYFRNRVDGRRDMYTESLYVSGSEHSGSKSGAK
jgi:hypothetical protein